MNLFDWKEIKNFSNNDLAEMIGVDPSYISHIKAGRRRPSPEVSKRIEEITNGDVTVLEMLFPAM
jgi:DNA-binding transcriptional regulator YdaS (Cro superfamily)